MLMLFTVFGYEMNLDGFTALINRIPAGSIQENSAATLVLTARCAYGSYSGGRVTTVLPA